MSRWSLPDRLNLLLVALVLLTAWGPLCHDGFQVGCDTLQFYGAGEMVNRGEASRLYDQRYFQSLQDAVGAIQGSCTLNFSFYPPMVALLLSPWAHLPFHQAQIVWWVAEILLFLVAGGLVYRGVPIAPRWRATVLLALATLLPVWMGLRVGQITPVWLVTLLGGMFLHQRGKRLTAGVVFSILAMKPQFAVPVFLWLLFRRDLRAMGGMILGVAAQTLAVMVFLGPDIPLYYLRELPNIAKAAKLADYSAVYEQSVAGTLKNVLFLHWWVYQEHLWMAMLVQPVVAVLAAIPLFQAVRAGQRLADRQAAPDYALRYEYACVVLFLVLMTPHLLLYDVALLAVPIVFLWSTPAWRMGTVLYLSTTVMAAFVYVLLSVSLMPFLAFWVLYRLSRELRVLDCTVARDTWAERLACKVAPAV